MMVVNRKSIVYHLFNAFENWPDEKSIQSEMVENLQRTK